MLRRISNPAKNKYNILKDHIIASKTTKVV